MAAYNFNDDLGRNYQRLTFKQGSSTRTFDGLIWDEGKGTLEGENVHLQLCGRIAWHCQIIDSGKPGDEKKYYYFDCAEVNASVCAELMKLENFEWRCTNTNVKKKMSGPANLNLVDLTDPMPVVTKYDEWVVSSYMALTVFSAVVYVFATWIEHEMAHAGKAVCTQLFVLVAGLALRPCVNLASKESIINLVWVNFGLFLTSLKSFVMIVCLPILKRLMIVCLQILKRPILKIQGKLDNTDSRSSACWTVFFLVFAIIASTISLTRKRRRHTVDASTELNQVEIQKFSA